MPPPARAACTSTRGRLATPAALHRDDPALGGGSGRARGGRAGLGAILTGVADAEAEFSVELSAAVPIERVEIRNRTELLEVSRPYRGRTSAGGSAWCGRAPNTAAAAARRCGAARSACPGNAWSGKRRPINRFNLDRRFDATPSGLTFEGVTTGGLHGRRGDARRCAGRHAGDPDQPGAGQRADGGDRPGGSRSWTPAAWDGGSVSSGCPTSTRTAPCGSPAASRCDATRTMHYTSAQRWRTEMWCGRARSI